MRFRGSNSSGVTESGGVANTTKCLQYSSRNGDKTRTTVECKSTCEAKWHEINGVVKKITTMGCLDHSHFADQCSDIHCKSFINAKLNEKDYKKHAPYARPNETVTLHMCCCTGNLCNGVLRPPDVRPYTSSVVTSPARPLETRDNLVPTGNTTIPLVASLLACGIVLAAVAFVLRKVCSPQRSTQPDFKEKLLPRFCSDQRPTAKLEVQITNEKADFRATDEINRSESIDINFDQSIGQGKFGIVYLARKGQTFLCFKEFRIEGNMDTYRNETVMHDTVQQYGHRNIVQYYGKFTVRSSVGILLEFCNNGPLRLFLDNHRTNVQTCCSFMLDIARAVAFLHSSIDLKGQRKKSIAHRDIKSSNIMVRDDLSLAVGDFGASLSLEGVQERADEDSLKANHLGAEGTPYYAAPEILDLSINLNRPRSSLKQADVYSMALVMWEIVNCCGEFYSEGKVVPHHYIPYQNEVTSESQLFDHVVGKGKRPTFEFLSHTGFTAQRLKLYHEDEKPHKSPTNVSCLALNLVKTIEECWDKDEEARLSAACVEDRLLTELSSNRLGQPATVKESSV